MLFAAGGVVGIISIGFWLFCIFDVLTAPAEHVRNLQKVLWVLIVLVGVEFGGIFWLIYGRPKVGVTAGARPAGRSAGNRRTLAPDDDVDFLRSLNKPRRDDGDAPAR